MLVSYNWLKRYIPDIPSESEISKLITFHVCELESEEKLPASTDRPNGDTVFDIKVLPDRSHDLLSHYGVAFEIAGLLGLEMINSSQNFLSESTNISLLGNFSARPDRPAQGSSKGNSASQLSIKIESPNCRRYMGRIVKGVKVGPSPKWMVSLLESIGQRSINNIVDATNFVLFDIGHPIHAFDLDKLANPSIVVREANDGDVIQLVGQDKLEAKLKSTDLVITDDENNLAIAGVKGGLSSGVSDTTTNLLIEVANFDPISVRKTSRRLSILSDASKRYENDLPLALACNAMDEISSLIKEMCPDAIFEEVVDIQNKKPEIKKVSFSIPYISRMLGVNIKREEIVKILENYHYEFTQNEDGFEVVVSPLRLDISGPHDFVEEIGRVYGYEKIPSQLPSFDNKDKDNTTWKKICLAKRHLLGEGYKEVMTSVFCEKGEVEILATSLGKNFLRTNISDGLRESFSINQKNIPLLLVDELKIFEVGAVFGKKGEEIQVAYMDKKNIVEVSLDKFINDTVLPGGEVDVVEDYLISLYSSYVVDEDPLMSLDDRTKISTPFLFNSWSVYPFMVRDIAVWIPEEVKPEALVKIYKEFGTELLVREPKLFDSFTKDGKTSYAHRLVFQSYDRTLTDEEISEIMQKITEKVVSFGWQVR